MTTLYRARVVRKDSEGVFVEVPDLGEGNEFGPLEMPDRMPLALGDSVLVGSINDIQDDLAAIAKLVTAAYEDPTPDPPYSPPANASFVLYYENAAARNAAITSPTSGMTTWLDDEQRLETYTDETPAGWVQAYSWKSGALSLPQGSKTGAGVASPTATLESLAAATSDPFLKARGGSDTQPRLQVGHDGVFTWGPGNAVSDVTVQRDATNPGLQVSPRLAVGGATSASVLLTVRTNANRIGLYSENTQATTRSFPHLYFEDGGPLSNHLVQSFRPPESNPRYDVLTDGTQQWGSGSATPDTNLYRNGANELKTDDSLVVGGNLNVGGTLSALNIPRWVNGGYLASNSASIGATETVILSLPSMTYKADTIYEVRLNGHFTGSVAGNRAFFRLRKTDETGTDLGSFSPPVTNASVQLPAQWFPQFKVGASDTTAVICITLQGSGAFNAQALTSPPFIVDVWESGPTSRATAAGIRSI